VTAIVFKCLSKSPDSRFQSATDLLRALERASSGRGTTVLNRTKQHWLALTITGVLLAVIAVGLGIYWKRQKTRTGMIDSIAVLPLDIRSKDPDADYISDGIAESINNSLARLPGLKVIPNSVALRYKGKAADFQKIGDALESRPYSPAVLCSAAPIFPLISNSMAFATENNSGASNTPARWPIYLWCKTTSRRRFRSGWAHNFPKPIGKS
jgi:hypothetical protein